MAPQNDENIHDSESTEVNLEEDMETDKPDTGDIDIKNRLDFTSYFKRLDNSVNQVYCSSIPQICRDEPCQLGVDEAGRGPVLGPVVYGISFAPLSKKQILVDIGCADPKSLTEDKRDAIFDKICDHHENIGWAIDAISPTYISNCMYRRHKTSLNEISMNSAINLIRQAIDQGAFITEIYVDTVGPPEKYQVKLQNLFPGIKIVVAKKADSTYPIVSAASICAKVSRDHALRAWQFGPSENNSSYGSGYPNDPKTKSWLADNVDQIFGFPSLVRHSWSTAEKILESKAIKIDWQDDEEEEETANEVKISLFFTKPKTNSKNTDKKQHEFFKSRCLVHTSEL